jgi:cytochrome c oxidase subunit II
MTFQDQVWSITIAGIGGVALVFLYVISQATRQAEAAQVQARANAIRRWYFPTLLALGVGVTAATLAPFPIPNQHTSSQARQVVKAVGQQWGWQLSPGPIETGAPVEFQVTSADVNHGFGIYDAGGRLLAQTQAMPGITNRLVYTFTQPGKYRVLCLEYCGLVHHGMMLEFDVIGTTEARDEHDLP